VRVGVLVDRHDPARGGMERALCALIEHLLATGDDVLVHTLAAAEGAPGDVRIVDDPRLPRGAQERALAARSVAAASADGCDVTLAVRHAPEVDVLWPHGGAHGATLAAGERSKGGVAASVSRALHRLSPRHRAFLELEREALEGGAGRVWCVSELVRGELRDAYPGCDTRLELHPNGVDRARFSPQLRAEHRSDVRAAWGVEDGAPLLVFPGGNLRLKGDLTDVAWTCVAVGVDVADAERDARAAGLAGRVVALPRQEMTRVLGAADLLVQPTCRDPCSLATLEALAAGVPVVTTDANGAAEVIGSGSGAVVPAGDASALSGELRQWAARVASDLGRAAASEAARAETECRDAQAWLERLAASLRDVARQR
jgi:UDP-glucose:(heptosyl)LPS alpha-1,3-glucosyltransferase